MKSESRSGPQRADASSTKVTVGVAPASLVLGAKPENLKISITVTANEVLTEVWAAVAIPVGPKPDAKPGQTFLLTKNSPVSLTSGGQDLDPVPAPDGCLAWKTDARDLDATGFTIDISGLEPFPGPGTASLKLTVKSDKIDLHNQDHEIQVKNPEGVFFDVFPDYVLHGGSDPVTVAWYDPKPENPAGPVLYKNNLEIFLKEDEIRRDEQGGIGGVFVDRPSFTTVYRLEAREKGDVAEHDRRPLGIRIVQVAQPGWNQQDLPQGYPALLAVNDAEGIAPRLYGIFVDRDRKASLWSSSTGFTGWQLESSRVPAAMRHSPGVVFQNKLWLIGGSSVDYGNWDNDPSNAVCCFNFADRSWEQLPNAPFRARSCHSCIAAGNQIVVLGGFHRGESLSDVCYSSDGRHWNCIENAWPKRCLCAAAEIEKELRIYGGFQHPANPDAALPEFWSAPLPLHEKSVWTRQADFEPPAAVGNPLGATLLYIPMLANLGGSYGVTTRSQAASRFAGNLLLAGSFRSNHAGGSSFSLLSQHIFRLSPFYRAWENNPVSWGWEQFPGAPFLLRSVSFNGFWFFWSLNRQVSQLDEKSWDARRPKLNIFIPS